VSNFTALLDACVLYPASLRDTLLRAASADLYRPQWSAQILDEVVRHLRADRGISDQQAQHLVAALREHFAEAETAGYERLIPSLTCHEKDRHVLAAAVRSHAQIIVTFNLKDFLAASLEPFGIAAQHPDAFLTHLFHLAPDTMVTLIYEQATALRNPPASIDRVLETLEQHAPVYVSALRAYLRDDKSRDF
jgi:predicted nucleic acid-binding protein